MQTNQIIMENIADIDEYRTIKSELILYSSFTVETQSYQRNGIYTETLVNEIKIFSCMIDCILVNTIIRFYNEAPKIFTQRTFLIENIIFQ